MRANFKARGAAYYAPALRRIQARGITVNGCFILGLDEHGPEGFASSSRSGGTCARCSMSTTGRRR